MPVQHLLSETQFDRRQLDVFFERVRATMKMSSSKHGRSILQESHLGLNSCIFFYEPSTRTSISFEKASRELGMHTYVRENARVFSSVAKGETVEDTVRILCEYGMNIIIIRHDRDDGPIRAASVSSVPIINAGGGKDKHPSQALLDGFTILSEKKTLENLTVVVGGDLKNARVAHSLPGIISLYPGNRIICLSHESRRMPERITTLLDQRGTVYFETDDIRLAMEVADVFYHTRNQTERVAPGEYQLTDADIQKFVVDEDVMRLAKPDMILMHPMPIGPEIPKSILYSGDTRVIPVKQAGYGIPVRQVIIEGAIKGNAWHPYS